jgi:peptide methionine sulfoxide reductase MsrB
MKKSVFSSPSSTNMISRHFITINNNKLWSPLATNIILISSFRFHSSSAVVGLDPPFTPIFKDERKQKEKEKQHFSVLCKECRTPIFDSSCILKGNPAWPTFYRTITKIEDDKKQHGETMMQLQTSDLLRISAEKLEDVISDNHQYLNSMMMMKSGEKTEKDALENQQNEKNEEQEKEEDPLIAKLLAPQRKSEEKRKNKTQSLILAERPPVMRFGINADRPERLKGDILSEFELKMIRAEEKAREKEFRGKVSSSKKLVKNYLVRNSASLNRGFCKKCDSFICMVFSGEQSSPSRQRFVCNPSSLVFK